MKQSPLHQQFKANQKAYQTLGLELPTTLEEVKHLLTKHQKAAIAKGTGQLVIAPAITTDFTFNDLLAAYKAHYKLSVFEALWNQYAEELRGQATVTVINTKTTGNTYGDAVTTHTGKTLEEQRKIKGEFLSPTEAILLLVLFKQQNKELAPNTFIRFPQLPNKTVVGGSCVGSVSSYYGEAWLDRSYGGGVGIYGVGLSVGFRKPLTPNAPSASPEPTPSSFSSVSASSLTTTKLTTTYLLKTGTTTIEVEKEHENRSITLYTEKGRSDFVFQHSDATTVKQIGELLIAASELE